MKNNQKNEKNFVFKKKFGQNFLSDKNLLASLVRLTPLSKETNVLEIGLGKGGLTEILVREAKTIVGYEIDTELQSFLQEKFVAASNLKLVFKDALKEDIKNIEKAFNGQNFSLIANIPYYITTPLIFKFLEETTKLDFAALMIQKEVAERICAPQNTENYGALSVICQYHCKVKILRNVSKKMFFPVPKVDSAFILLEKQKEFDFEFARLVRASFNMRRKTLMNNLLQNYNLEKENASEIFANLGLDANLRAENLSVEDFENLLQQIKTFFGK